MDGLTDKLDVGAGHLPRGTVNLDLYPEQSLHRQWGKTKIPMQKHSIPNFIRADAQHLPFKNSSFTEVYSSNTLEHVSDPWLMIREMIRVAKREVTLIIPHRFGRGSKDKPHTQFFTLKRVDGYVKSLHNPKVYFINGEITRWRGFLHEYLSLFRLPQEMKITIILQEQN